MKGVLGFLSLLVVLVHCQVPQNHVTDLLNEVNEKQIETYTSNLVNQVKNRFYWCSWNTQKTEDYIVDTFKNMGLATDKKPFVYKDEHKTHNLNNVVATYKSANMNSAKMVILGAHMDSYTKEGDDNRNDCSIKGPGALDNAAGVAALLEVARILTTRKPKLNYQVRFIAFGCEEDGLVGSAAYVRNQTLGKRFPPEFANNVIGVLNADVIGYKPNLWVWQTKFTTPTENTYLRRVYNRYRDTINSGLVFQDPVWEGSSSDNKIFALRTSIQTTFLTSTAEDEMPDFRFPEIHQDADTLAIVDFGLVQAATKLILAYAMRRAELSGEAARCGALGKIKCAADPDCGNFDPNQTPRCKPLAIGGAPAPAPAPDGDKYDKRDNARVTGGRLPSDPQMSSSDLEKCKKWCDESDNCKGFHVRAGQCMMKGSTVLRLNMADSTAYVKKELSGVFTFRMLESDDTDDSDDSDEDLNPAPRATGPTEAGAVLLLLLPLLY